MVTTAGLEVAAEVACWSGGLGDGKRGKLEMDKVLGFGRAAEESNHIGDHIDLLTSILKKTYTFFKCCPHMEF